MILYDDLSKYDFVFPIRDKEDLIKQYKQQKEDYYKDYMIRNQEAKKKNKENLLQRLNDEDIFITQMNHEDLSFEPDDYYLVLKFSDGYNTTCDEKEDIKLAYLKLKKQILLNSSTYPEFLDKYEPKQKKRLF